MNKRYGKNQTGAVSLLTVIFVMIFITLIVVGYIGLVTFSHRQTIDNSLSSSALAAARNGIEEGKRILLYCAQNPTSSDCVESVLNSTDNCRVFTSGAGASLANKLGISINPAGEGLSGGAFGSGAEDYQQYYTCLTVQTQTPYITDTITPDKGSIQELKSTDNFNRLRLSWSKSGTFTSGSTIDWPSLNSWGGATQPYPPILELQLISYRDGDFQAPGGDPLTYIENQTQTVYIVPCGNNPKPVGCVSAGTANMITSDLRAGPGIPRTSTPIVYATCNFSGGYDCSIKLTLTTQAAQNDRHYYARTNVIYGDSTELELSLMNGANIVNFDGVQPWIDVTGRANDVFRRVRAQVKPGLDLNFNLIPQHVLESARPVCKVMTVTNDATTTTYGCNN